MILRPTEHTDEGRAHNPLETQVPCVPLKLRGWAEGFIEKFKTTWSLSHTENPNQFALQWGGTPAVPVTSCHHWRHCRDPLPTAG